METGNRKQETGNRKQGSTLHFNLLAFSKFLVLAALTFAAGSFGSAAHAASSYILTIPDTLNVTQEGWNALENITANNTDNNFDGDRKLTVTATSANSWALKSGTNSIGYNLATAAGTYSSTATPASWVFSAAELNNASGAAKTAGIIVDDYSGKPVGTYTDTVTFTVKVEQIITDLSTLTDAYTAQDGEILTGTLQNEVRVSIAPGATVTLKNANINGSGTWKNGYHAGLTCNGSATLILDGENTVKGFHQHLPGIHVPEDNTLTIQGPGKLNASSNGQGAGIGGGFEISCGNIVIEGGNITATGGNGAAGIGSGDAYVADANSVIISVYGSACGDITITGGTITATGGTWAAGIGSGYQGSCGNITIADTVASVTATKGSDAPNSIGEGLAGSCGTVTIGGAVVGPITQSPYTYEPN